MDVYTISVFFFLLNFFLNIMSRINKDFKFS